MTKKFFLVINWFSVFFSKGKNKSHLNFIQVRVKLLLNLMTYFFVNMLFHFREFIPKKNTKTVFGVFSKEKNKSHFNFIQVRVELLLNLITFFCKYVIPFS